MAVLDISGLADAKKQLLEMDGMIARVRDGVVQFADDTGAAADDILGSFESMGQATGNFVAHGLAQQGIFTDGITSMHAKITAHLDGEWKERLVSLAGFFEEGLSREQMFTEGLALAQTAFTGHLDGELVERLGNLTGFLDESLGKEQVFSHGVALAQTALTEHLGGEIGQRLGGMIDFFDESEDLAEGFARKYRSIENSITGFVQGSAQDRMVALGGMFGALSDMLGEAGKENRAAAVAQRVMAIAQAGINTAQAVSRSLAAAPFPINVGLGAAAAAAGAVQIARIRSTTVPSAETGGRFFVPNARGVDSALMRVNPGEEINVTPRGTEGGENIHYTFKISEQVIFDIVTRGIRSGEILIEPAANL